MPDDTVSAVVEKRAEKQCHNDGYKSLVHNKSSLSLVVIFTKALKKSIAGLTAFSMLFCLSIPAFASETSLKQGSFWGGLFASAVHVSDSVHPIVGTLVKAFGSQVSKDVCNFSDDGFHHGSPLRAIGPGSDGLYQLECTCDNCGQKFYVAKTPQEIEDCYSSYVNTLPGNTYTSDGKFRIYPSADTVKYVITTRSVGSTYFSSGGYNGTWDLPEQISSSNYFLSHPNGIYSFHGASIGSFESYVAYGVIWDFSVAGNARYKFFLPGTSSEKGFYTTGIYPDYSIYTCFLDERTDGSTSPSSFRRYWGVSPSSYTDYRSFSATTRCRCITYYYPYSSSCPYAEFSSGLTFDFSMYDNGELPYVELVETYDSTPTVTPSTRPTNLELNYGIKGDNGQMTVVKGDIVNETNKTVYNPVTGETSNITNWTYDYADRSYTVTTDNSSTMTITYGDENVTIREGDTIYNIYYMVPNSTEEHQHTYTSAVTKEPTCIEAGVKTYTCTCGDSYTEAIPALGHDWQVKQTVTTQYDETGQLIQEGYTIYECSRCHEQYKSTDGTAPPGGGGTNTPGDVDGETIWQKLGKLLGLIGEGAVDLIAATLGKLLDALISLASQLMEKLKTVVDTVLSLFDVLPSLFGGFLAFLTAVFPYLPTELLSILTFGVLAVVFIGILKAVRR